MCTYTCAYIFICHTYTHILTLTDTYTQPMQSCFGGDVDMFSGLISLHWTANKETHAWEGLSLLLSAVISCLTFFCLWWDFMKLSSFCAHIDIVIFSVLLRQLFLGETVSQQTSRYPDLYNLSSPSSTMWNVRL